MGRTWGEQTLFPKHTCAKGKVTHSLHQTAVQLRRPLWLTYFLVPQNLKGVTTPTSSAVFPCSFLLFGNPWFLRVEKCRMCCSNTPYPWGTVTYVRKRKLVGMKFLLQEQAKTTAEISFLRWVLGSCGVVPAHRTQQANLLCERQWPFKAGCCERLNRHFTKTITSKAGLAGQGDFVGTHSAIPFSRWRADTSRILGDADQWYCTYTQWNPDNLSSWVINWELHICRAVPSH